MRQGTIKFFNSGKAFGFVTPDGGGADIYLPAGTLAACGITKVSLGQRVTFEQGEDKRGPKVVSLALLAEVVAAKAPDAVTIYCDPDLDGVENVLDAICAAGYQIDLLNYLEAPPTQERLLQLSHMLSGSGKSLVRRSDPLFQLLRLDDRFIGEQEFWTVVAEHPTLINGPVLVFAGRVRVCKSEEDVKAFLSNGGEITTPRPKTLSPRIAALIRGEAVAPLQVEILAQRPDPSPRDEILVQQPEPAPPKSVARIMSRPPKKSKRKAPAKSGLPLAKKIRAAKATKSTKAKK